MFWRLGFVKDRNGLKEIQQVAGGLSSRVGIAQLDLDCVLWSIGDVCGERRAFCGKCPLDFYCPTFLKGGPQASLRLTVSVKGIAEMA